MGLLRLRVGLSWGPPLLGRFPPAEGRWRRRRQGGGGGAGGGGGGGVVWWGVRRARREGSPAA